MVSVEVLEKNGLYYKAFIKNIHKEKLEVNFENSLEEKLITFAEARLPALSPENTDFREGDEIEVYMSGAGREEWGWCIGTLKLMKGEFAVVEFTNDSNSDIISLDRIRFKNKNPPLESSNFYSVSFDIPEDLFSTCNDEESHIDLKMACGAEVIRVDAQAHTITVISSSKRAINKATILADMHLRNLRQKLLLINRMNELTDKLESSKHVNKAAFEEEFEVARELMGLAIGNRGSNIAQARGLEGVTSIDIDEGNNVFRVCGQNETAVKAARKLLEYGVKVVPVCKNLVSKVIGKSGHSIQEIVNKSGVIRVNIKDHNQKQQHGNVPDLQQQHGDVPDLQQQHGDIADLQQQHGDAPDISSNDSEEFIEFEFTGTYESNCNAVMLLDYQIGHLKEVDKLRQEKLSIDEELKSLNPIQSMRFRRNQEGFNGGGNNGNKGTRWSAERPVSKDDSTVGKDVDRRTSVDLSGKGRGPNRGRGGGVDGGRRRGDDVSSEVLTINGGNSLSDNSSASIAGSNSTSRPNNNNKNRNKNRNKKNNTDTQNHQDSQVNGDRAEVNGKTYKQPAKQASKPTTKQEDTKANTPTETQGESWK